MRTMETDITLGIDVENKLFDTASLIRAVENQLLLSFADNEISGTIHTCIGQELSAVIVCHMLQAGDAIVSNHRCHGHFLARTDCVEGLITEIYGKTTGVCGGRGGSQHLCKDGFFSNGIQGGIVPVCAGIAYAKKLKQQQEIAVVFIGDGTLGEGVLYETLNIVAKWELPLLVVLENNLYAQSTHQSQTLSGSITGRAQSFGIETGHGDIWRWQSLFNSAQSLVHFVRSSGKPALLQIDCYRLKAHSKGDDNRDPMEVENFNKMDPLNQRLATHDNAASTIDHSKRIDNAINKARNDIFAAYVELDSEPLDLFPLNGVTSTNDRYSTTNTPSEKDAERIVKHINWALRGLLLENDNVLLIGEDLESPYGGAFKATQGLSDEFPGRVINSPISEAAIVGIGCGLALEGIVPIIEIMFGDFITLAYDQIVNHASKFRYIYNDQVSVPLIIRTPMGGRRGYGPTHSQTLDKHFLGVSGLNVYAINSLFDPALLYRALVSSSKDPALVIENKALYAKKLQTQAPQGFYFKYCNGRSPAVLVLPDSQVVDLTIIAYGGLADDVLSLLDVLFFSHDLIAQLICPIQLYPFDLTHYQQYINKSRYLFVIEEGQGFCGFASELISQLAERNMLQQLVVKRLAASVSPIPAAKPLERSALPDGEDIMELILETYYENNTANA